MADSDRYLHGAFHPNGECPNGVCAQPSRALDAAEPWCPEHGYGCQPQDCPCGHSLRCDCRSIADEH